MLKIPQWPLLNELKYFDEALHKYCARLCKEAAELADYCSLKLLCVCIAGERAPYTGLKPSGLDWGPVVQKVERDMKTKMQKK